MLALQGDAESAGAVLRLPQPRPGGRARAAGGIEVDVGGAEPMACAAACWSIPPACTRRRSRARSSGMPPERIPTAYYAKGNYFTLAGRSPFSRLIYPVPVPGGLGVHLTHRPRRPGAVRAGRGVDRRRSTTRSIPRARRQFYAAVRRYWPALPDGALQPGYSGIRPKIVPPRSPRRISSFRARRRTASPG